VTTALTPARYDKLTTDLLAILEKGKEKALSAVNQIRLETYWKMGKRLADAHELDDPNEESSLMSRLSEDLKMDLPLLYRIKQFYTLWSDEVPVLEGHPTLSWSHFVEMLSIKDGKERDYYFKQASTEGWSRDILRKAIEKDLFTISQTKKQLSSGTPTLERPVNPLHVYKAIVEKVVDGDTLLVRVDLGFDVWVNQRARFRGINTAELVKNGIPSGPAAERGEKAKAFVEGKLKDIGFIVLKSYKTDIFGRYVADIFYHPTIAKKEEVYSAGFFLNAELLAAGLADLML